MRSAWEDKSSSLKALGVILAFLSAFFAASSKRTFKSLLVLTGLLAPPGDFLEGRLHVILVELSTLPYVCLVVLLYRR